MGQVITKMPEGLFVDRTTGGLIWSGEMPKARYEKEREEQKNRTRKKAEVLTPVWIVNKMIENLLEEDPDALNPDKTCLDICTGEGVFITTLYEPDTGESIPLEERKGVLDRKLAAITASGHEDWIDTATQCLKSVYGYEYQADSLAICRRNVLQTMIENYDAAFNEEPSWYQAEEWAEIISWNFPHMDGLNYRKPDTDIPVRIMDWNTGKEVLFDELRKD